MALFFAERGRDLQVYTAQGMLTRGLFKEAMDARTHFNLQQEIRAVSPTEQIEMEHARAQRYARLPPP
eukprot:CAMPEP_0206272394 /NCGR_PEP_ID=MMETSP0047_2-20121206/33981_1 /ASSEMBLY_ACC=CAM_ASM_000192 /TAXON_ID=195065 /ORGANISM="Chroomonas mesostigmatica_cf, Strain CCMP1168" /LENGTH=67 /DNA_ID=CAMNT_0053701305 /DNA_START=57 /DNA_END=257 /DNA_ORIENTATION=+